MGQLNFQLLVLFAVFVKSMTLYTDCDSDIGTLVSVQLSNCSDDDSVCIWYRNTNVTGKLTFSLEENVESVGPIVYGCINGRLVPFPVANPDGCVDSGLSCPLQSGRTYTFETSFLLSEIFPMVTVDVKWKLLTESGLVIACVLIPSKIQ